MRPGLRQVLSDLYDAEVAHLDDEIGRLLGGMREAGLLEKTLIVIVGDHGEGLTDHGWMEHGSFLHRELLRVPLLVRPPGGCPPRVVTDLVRIQDAFPTILEACSVAVPEGIDGRSLTGETAGRTLIGAERTRRDVVEAVERAVSREAAAPLRIGRRTLYDGKHHLLVADDGKVELYAPAEDPGETRDLSGSMPELVAKLREALDATKPPPPTPTTK
jgi:arylsulfatase A-like enzyme